MTFSCYGAHLHGNQSGSVDRSHNVFGSPVLDGDLHRALTERERMLQAPYLLDEASREVVLAAIRRHCGLRAWNLLAAHVRSTHVHVVVEAEAHPDRIAIEFKAYASRELSRLGKDGADRKRWARHASTRWLWKDDDVRSAVRYVADEQGEPMASFVGELI